MTVFLWIGFILFVLGMLAIDLGVLHREAEVINSKQALRWVCVSILLALIFNVLVYFMYENHWLGLGTEKGFELDGYQAALQFFTGWLIEQSLSLDNVFVIVIIFAYFGIPIKHQHRVLFWGIIGALIMRGAMIGAGAVLVHNLDWVNYLFGALLVFTAIKMALVKEESLDLDRSPIVRFARKLYPVTTEFEGQNFFTIQNGRRAMTPLFMALLVVETMDVLFAIDSIPAVFAITRDAFLVFTSNVFAILNLRSLYFTLAIMIKKFHHVKSSLVVVLLFVGIKMLLNDVYEISTVESLAVISTLLLMGLGFSALFEQKPKGSS